MRTPQNTPVVPMNLRLPKDIADWVTARAITNDRTRHTEIINILRTTRDQEDNPSSAQGEAA